MKNNKITKINKWIDYNFDIGIKQMDNFDIERSVKSLFTERFNKLLNDETILIQFKLLTLQRNYRSISHIQTIKNSETDMKELIKTFKGYWSSKSKEYKKINVSEIIYIYKILPKDSIINERKLNKIEDIDSKIKKFEEDYSLIGSTRLWNTMDITKWGDYSISEDYKKASVIKDNSESIYDIDIKDTHNEVKLKLKFNEKIILAFNDYMNNGSNLGTFTRRIEGKLDTFQEYIYEEGKLVLKRIKGVVSFLTKLNLDSFLSYKFITMDLETREMNIKGNRRLVPYCVSIYDGATSKSFYLEDYKDENEMLKNSIYYIMRRKYHGYRVYLHNFSNFDSIFLISVLSNFNSVIKPLINDGKYIELKFRFGDKNQYYLLFRDSYLLLPSSLRELAINFKVSNKEHFPYLFVNDSTVPLNYEGMIPEYKYYSGITEEEFNSEYKDERLFKKIKDCKYQGITPEEYKQIFIEYLEGFKVWNLRNETIQYCEQDCISLYEVIKVFSERTYKKFKVDIHKCPTLSSLSFKIYRSNFLKDEYKIPLITGRIYEFIKQSYMGGGVDVYKPYGENIYVYDVNSLYPNEMKEQIYACW
jgi:hypothetical protein